LLKNLGFENFEDLQRTFGSWFLGEFSESKNLWLLLGFENPQRTNWFHERTSSLG
jgi:hypothetical protein